jgi:hypothetical protein
MARKTSIRQRSSARGGIPTWLLLAGGGFVAYFLITKLSSAAKTAMAPRPVAAAPGATLNIAGQNIPVTQVASAVTSAVDKIFGPSTAAPASATADLSTMVTSL